MCKRGDGGGDGKIEDIRKVATGSREDQSLGYCFVSGVRRQASGVSREVMLVHT